MKKQYNRLTIAVSVLLAVCLLLSGCGTSVNAETVTADAWYYEAVEYVTQHGLMDPLTKDGFAPEENATRGVIIEALWRAAGRPEAAGKASFTDVKQNVKSVNWAVENGVVNGYPDGHLGTEEPVTREQFAAMLWRAADEPSADAGARFADADEIESYAREAAAWCEECGFMTGRPGRIFDPKANITRAEVAAVLERYVTAFDAAEAPVEENSGEEAPVEENPEEEAPVEVSDHPVKDEAWIYTDKNGDTAVIPADFAVSEKEDEQTINTGLVVIATDGSEYVWIPTTVTALSQREFNSYFFGGSLSEYRDETELDTYRAMAASVEQYGGFYLGRYEASRGDDGLPVSKPVTEENPGRIYVQYSPQDATVACENLYADNPTVQGFFPWGANWDTALQWLIDSGCLKEEDVTSDSTAWGNYSDDTFSEGARGNYTGVWEEAKTNNIYDLAGNNWEWTQERCGSNYVMRGGGYNLMGGSCPGSFYPAAIRDPLPGNNHHPNVTFRAALYIKAEG